MKHLLLSAFLIFSVLWVYATSLEDGGWGPRIYKGYKASESQFKYQALLHMKTQDGELHFCGGVLISNDHVLTAAHCCYEFKEVTIFLGMINFKSPKKIERKASSIIIHKDYDNFTLQNDICILRMEAPVEYSKNVGPIKLTPERKVTYYDGGSALIMGWGDNGYSEHTENLQWAAVRVFPHQFCRLATYMLTGSSAFMHESQICTYFTSPSWPCRGDSGGALVTSPREAEPPVLIGLVSFMLAPFTCSSSSTPRVYTYVGHYLDFVRTHTDPPLS